MGAHSKEIQLIDTIKNGDLQAAVKIIHKNVKQLNTSSSGNSSGTSRFLFKRDTENGTLSRKNSKVRSLSVDNCSNENICVFNKMNLKKRYILIDNNKNRSDFSLKRQNKLFLVKNEEIKNKIGNEDNLPDEPNTLLVKSKINLNYQNENGMTSLHQACISSTSPELALLLLESGANPSIKDRHGYFPLHYACQYAKLDIIQILLKFNNNNVNELTLTNNDTPMHLLIQYSTNLNASIIEKAVHLLLINGAYKSLAYANKTQNQTPFEMACDLGRTNIIETIFQYCISQPINQQDQHLPQAKFRLLNILSKYSLNSLHLASRNGHNDIIRLLLIYNVCDLNGLEMANGCTALHEACRYGRYQTVKLLLECGADLTKMNFYGKRPIDVIIKNNKIENDIKCVINEFSQSFGVVAIKPHVNTHSGALNFDLNEHITVLESNANSSIINAENNASLVALNWRGFILNRLNYTTRFGYFPSSYVKTLGNHNDLVNKNILLNNANRPSFVTSSTTSLLLAQHNNNNTHNNDLIKSQNISVIEKLSSNNQNDQIYSSNIRLFKKTDTQQQKIYGSIGNIQSSTNLLSFSALNQITNSNTNEFSPSSTSSASSTTSSSSSSSSSKNTKSNTSISPKSHITPTTIANKIETIVEKTLFNCLKEINGEKYLKNFIDQGFDDLLTIAKITPSDLTAIGIKDPNDRNLLKSHMNKYFSKLLANESKCVDSNEFSNINTIEDFLKHINLEQYSSCIKSYFTSLNDFLKNLNLEDLEEIGLRKLGHQKKLMLNVKNFKFKAVISPIKNTQETKSNFSTWSLGKSLENLKNISNEITTQTTVKPALPARNDSSSYDSFTNSSNKSTSLSYATLPRNISSSNNRRFHPNLNLDTAESSMLIQQMVPTPPAMPLISISPVGKTSNQIGASQFNSSDSSKPILNKNEIINGSGIVNKHVLNDIDSMLCDLNRQLDEMLDYEKIIFRV